VKAMMKVKLVFSGVLLCSISLSAFSANEPPDLSGFWTISFQPQTTGPAQDLRDKFPEGSIFVDDGGAGELGEGEYSGLKLSQRALQEVREYNPENELTLENSCVAPSVTFYMQAPFPIEIHQGRDIIVFKIEYYDMYRVIFMDGREHPPADTPHSKNGHSVGHWEGDELVVDTTHISSATFMNNGFNHSDDIHLVERFKISDDGNSLWSTEVMEDSETFSGQAARFVAWRKVPNEYIYPYECRPDFMESSGE
jgi:hypothetical protein